MKMKWEEPKIEVQTFMPNEYVAVCAEGNCNITGYVYHDYNGNGVVDGGDGYNYYNSACYSDFYVQGTDSQTPANNSLVFQQNQMDGYYLFGIFVPTGVKDSQKDKGTPAFNWDDHVTTKWNQNPDRPNHS